VDAIVLAGGVPRPGEPLYNITNGAPKAMLDIAGKPMIQWVLDAISKSKIVENVVVAGLDESCGLSCDKNLYYVPNQSGMIENIRAASVKVKEINPSARHILMVSSDIPTVTGEMFDFVLQTAREEDKDIIYNIIPRNTMEKRFPNARRTYVHFKNLVFCSADSHVISLRIILEDDLGIWRKITDARKSPLNQAALIGFDTLLLYLLRLLTIQKLEKKIIKQLNITGKASIVPYAEIGMDVDKPHHLEIVRTDLQKRSNA